MKKLYVESDIQDIADAIREKNGKDDTYKPAEMGDAVRDIGGFYDVFWDAFQDNGNKTYYTRAFSCGTIDASTPSHWTDANFKPKYNMYPVQAGNMFEYCGVTDLCKSLEEQGVTLDFINAYEVNAMNYCFRGAETVTLPPIDLTNVKNLTGTFICNKLKRIELNNLQPDTPFLVAFDLHNTTNCLEEIVITGTMGQNGFDVKRCSLLSHDSLLNILNILEDKTGDTSGTEWKVTLGSVNIAKLTETELDIAYQKGWTVI